MHLYQGFGFGFEFGFGGYGGGISSTVLCRFNCNICHCGLCIYQFQNSQQMATAMISFPEPEPRPEPRGKWNIFLFLLYSPAKTVTTLAADACRVRFRSVRIFEKGVGVAGDQGIRVWKKGQDSIRTNLSLFPPRLLLSFSAGSTLMVVRKH